MCVYVRDQKSPVSNSTSSQQLGLTLVCVISTWPSAWHIVGADENLLNRLEGDKIDILLLDFYYLYSFI